MNDQGYAFRCDGKLWVVTDPDVAMKWQEQGFIVTPVIAGSPQSHLGYEDGYRDAWSEPCPNCGHVKGSELDSGEIKPA